MPIRERVQRLWRLVVRWWRPGESHSPSEQTPPSAAPASPSPLPNRQRPSRKPRTPTAHPVIAGQGERLIGGAITVWMWSVGGRLILATSPSEAERAIVRLLPELPIEERAGAQQLLDALRAPSAVAA